MLRTSFALFLACVTGFLLFGQSQEKQPKPKLQDKPIIVPPTSNPNARPYEPYDPDKLPYGEVACGRPESKRSVPCRCMETRLKQHDEAELKCETLGDKKMVLECLKKLPDLCGIHVIDADEANRIEYDDNGNEIPAMPKQCGRSCHKAHCECCKS